MIREGTYEEYRRRLNARRRQQLAGKKRAMGTRGAASGDIFARHLAAHERIWN